MLFYIHQLFILTADLTLASAVFCILYALTCLCIGFVVSLLICLCSFGAVKSMKKSMDPRGDVVLSLAAKNTIENTGLGPLEEVDFDVLAAPHVSEANWDCVPEKECPSSIKATQLPWTEKTPSDSTQTLVESKISQKEMSGVIRRPSIFSEEEEKEMPKEDKRNQTCKQKKSFLSPALLLGLLWAPVDLMYPLLKKTSDWLFNTLQKSKD